MSVVIEGVNAPTNCHECIFYLFCGFDTKELAKKEYANKRHKGCPVKEPSSKNLIDADALKAHYAWCGERKA